MTDQSTADQILAARAANVDSGRAANQANAVTGLYGISGSGKSSLADTAAERCYDKFGKITLCYAADLGGFGNKRLTLIRRGIMRVYDPRNHVNPFETMELISLGAFPERLVDPERGYADPNVALILPRRMVFVMSCPNGHEVKRFDDQRVMVATSVACPTCGTVTGVANAKIEQQVVRHRMFKDVGLRIYDSMTALNDWGMQDLQEQSAKGSLPASSSGGSMLGAADALRSGRFVFGGSSVAQYGFLQNRTYGWLANIRTIPDQVMPAIATFMVEQSKGTDESGGDLLLGPKIAGNARTAALPGWLGNLLHASKEPVSNAPDAPMVYRLWLTNHIDPRDPRRIPYVAKHRGTPLGMPDFLEDEPSKPAWSTCSLAVFFDKLDEQLKQLEAEAERRYPHAPGLWVGDEADVSGADDVVAAVQSPAAPAGGVGSAAPAVVTGARSRRRVGAPAPPAPAIQQPEAANVPAAAAVSGQVPTVPAQETLAVAANGTLAATPAANGQETAATEQPAAALNQTPTTSTPPPTGGASASIPAPAASVSPAPVPPTPPSVATPTPPTTRLRRVARPPV